MTLHKPAQCPTNRTCPNLCRSCRSRRNWPSRRWCRTQSTDPSLVTRTWRRSTTWTPSPRSSQSSCWRWWRCLCLACCTSCCTSNGWRACGIFFLFVFGLYPQSFLDASLFHFLPYLFNLFNLFIFFDLSLVFLRLLFTSFPSLSIYFFPSYNF